MENKNFDKYIKDLLENIESETPKGDWSLMEEQIQADPELGFEGVEDLAFDQSIKAQLDPMDVAFNAEHWSAFESHLDAEMNTPEIEDITLDGIVYENLADLRIPYNHSHWTLMSNRLDEEFSFRRKLYKYKVAELALMILAIFTLLQFLPFKKKQVASSQEQSKITTNQFFAKANEVNEIDKEEQIVNLNNTSLSTSEVSPSTSSLTENETLTMTTPPSSIIPTTTIETQLSELTEVSQQNNLESENRVPLVDHTNLEDNLPQANAIQSTDTPMNIEAADVYTLNAIDFYPSFESFEFNSLAYDRPFESLSCSTCAKKAPAKIRIGMFLSTDLNKIVTPEQLSQTGKTDGYSQYSLDYGGGLTIGLKYQKWEIETGITYAHMIYQPEITRFTAGTFIGGYQSAGFDRVNLNILKIPVNLHYNINNIGKWHLYAMGGASVNLVVIDHYNVTTTTVGTTSVPRPTSSSTRSPNIPETSKYDGLFEGGQLVDNRFYTANIGLGLERYLTPRWSIFVQPVYQYQFVKDGIGPNDDRFHTMSIQLGAKSSFK